MDNDLASIIDMSLRRMERELSPRSSLSAARAYLWIRSMDGKVTAAEVSNHCGIAWDTASLLIKKHDAEKKSSQ